MRDQSKVSFFKKKKKKSIHLRGECRHQFRVLGEFKRGVDVAHENWLDVREGTHLLGEHPLHPYKEKTSYNFVEKVSPY
ncbi:hypothetical protein Hanom_Chr06g00498271 [Helianthus anomalus]